MAERTLDIELGCGHIMEDVGIASPYRITEQGTLKGPKTDLCPWGHGMIAVRTLRLHPQGRNADSTRGEQA